VPQSSAGVSAKTAQTTLAYEVCEAARQFLSDQPSPGRSLYPGGSIGVELPGLDQMGLVDAELLLQAR
jgi:hypothetical protein